MNSFPPLVPEPPPPGLPPEKDPFWGYRDLALLIGFALPALLISAVIVRLITRAVSSRPVLPAVGVLATQFLFYGFWFLCLYALIRFRYGKSFWRSLAWVGPSSPMVLYAAAGPALAVGIALAGVALRTPEIEMPMKVLLGDPVSLILVGIFAVTIGPVCEELAFRGFLLPLLARSLGAVAGVVLTGVLFALMHGPEYAWSWQHVLLITVAGIAFGVVRLRSSSTSAAALMHATYNLTFFAGYIIQSGNARF